MLKALLAAFTIKNESRDVRIATRGPVYLRGKVTKKVEARQVHQCHGDSVAPEEGWLVQNRS